MCEVISLVNILLILVVCLFFFLKVSMLPLLLIVEITWIFLFSSFVLSGLLFNIPTALGMTLFCLVVSGIEFGVGLTFFYLFF